MVFIHGWALDLDMWQPQLHLLASSFQVIAFDRRGFGLSSGRPDIERDVEDVARLLDYLAISQAAIVGMSQGARVALRCALKYPQRVACLVLDGPPPDGLSLTPDIQEVPIDDYRALLRSEGIEAFRRSWSQHPFMRLYTTALGARLLLQEIAARYPAQDLLLDERPRSAAPLTMRDLHCIDVCTLVLSGEFDTQRRRTIAQRMVEALPNAYLRIVAGAGHLAALDEPSLYARLLSQFLRSQPISNLSGRG
ncbi:alpha/beta hydrolase [Steroidobacter sp. S1-65]|uniref:Alpha/beta hydrolase n=1 Tax=Steroidobacter gossypii TaxID=2805490 RepID=A0ABS1X121_9GAMM|nr:alpha/beta hydrolase [Steroidobacter gossypii]MBM0106931.1 alpha/beta hydrolase [Steroidobacter gossypii]